MGTVEIFITQLSMSILVFALLAKWVVWPWLNEKTAGIALMILVAPHTIRHIGLTFLVPSVTDPAISQNFALLSAWGDFTSGVLAILVLFALRHQWKMATSLLWLFNTIGTLDLLKALSNPDVVPTLGGTWYIPTFLVPVLLVSHVMIFILLVKGKSSETAARFDK